MAGPMAEVIPSIDNLRAIASPVERARAVSRFARTFGTLPTALYELRREALTEARRTATVATIAAAIGLSSARVFQLTRTTTTTTEAAA